VAGAKVVGPLDYRAWIAAIREGRTFVTRGPLPLLTVDGHDPGETLSGPREAAVVVDSPGFDGRLEVVAGGEVIASGGGPRLEATVPLTRGVARAGEHRSGLRWRSPSPQRLR